MTAPIKTCDFCNATGVMPTFMDGTTVCYDCLPTLPKTLREAWREIVLLRTKIEQMERQEPVGWLLDGDFYEVKQMSLYKDNEPLPGQTALYALPGAQPAQSVPEGWKPIPEEHQTFDLVDLRLADGSVLCGCVSQADGDYWWKGPSGEVFIDPKYASVTHWRLAAAPEAKP